MLLENARQKQRWHSHPREALLLCSLALLPRCSAWWAGAGSAVLRTTVIKTGSGGHNSRRSSCKARFGVGGYGRLQHSRGSGRPRIGELRCSAASRPPGEVLDSASGIVGPAYDEAGALRPSANLPAEDECFLAADGAEYCVTEPLRPWQASSVTASSLEAPTGPIGEFVEGEKEALGRLEAAGTGNVTGSSSRPLFTMMGLCFLVAIVCALDRVAMSVAIVPMGKVYGYSDTTKGLISSVFSWGYMASIVPSSVLIGVWGPKATIATGVLVWSAAQMLSPAAAGVSLQTLLACRFAMGMGEAVTLPSIQAIVAEWVPQDQRSRWLALIISGLQIGTVLAYLASPAIIEAWVWEGVFLAYGAIGLAWLALWLPLVSDRPPGSVLNAASSNTGELSQLRPPQDGKPVPKNPPVPGAEPVNSEKQPLPAPAGGEGSVVDQGRRASSASPASTERINGLSVETVPIQEASDVVGGLGEGVAGDNPLPGGGENDRGGVLTGFKDVPWKEYATSGQIWSISAAHMAHNWGLYVMLAWLPTYFSQEFHLSLGQSSGASVVPWVAGAIAGNLAGWGADALVNKGILDLRAVRKLFQTLALVGPAACMLALAQAPETAEQASALFTGAVALGSCSCAGFGSSVQDLRSRDTGVIYGMTSACSALFGSSGTYLTGVVLDTTDSWATVFQVTAAVYLIGAGIYGSFYRAEPLELEKRA